MISKKLSFIVVCILLGIFTVLSVASAVRESLTFDEIVHMQEGKNAILKHEFLIDTNNPPLIRELAVIPLVLGVNRYISSSQPNIQALPARLVIIFLGMVLGITIYLFTAHYLGQNIGLFALFLYVFEPNILANNHYVTQDMGATLFFFLSYISLIQLLSKPSWRAFFINGVALGLMAATKITTLPYFAVSALILLPFLLKNKLFGWIYKYPVHIMASLFICALVIWSTYFFNTNVIIAPGDAQGRVSTTIINIATKQHNTPLLDIMGFLQKQPVPLGDYIGVLKNTVVRSSRESPVFFMGKNFPSSQWYFMIVNTGLKTPIALVIFMGIGLYFAFRHRNLRRKVMIILIPVFSILFVSSVSRMQPLVRYVLPVFPYICILAGLSLSVIKSRAGRVIVLSLCVWYVVSSLMFYPHFISYSNELAGSKNTRYLKFTDSNMDWGQSLISFKRYIDEVKPSKIQFSYFGRDDAALYGMQSDFPYGSYKFNEICSFHEVNYPSNFGPSLIAISLSNWYGCGYNLDPTFAVRNIRNIIANSILVY